MKDLTTSGVNTRLRSIFSRLYGVHSAVSVVISPSISGNQWNKVPYQGGEQITIQTPVCCNVPVIYFMGCKAYTQNHIRLLDTDRWRSISDAANNESHPGSMVNWLPGFCMDGTLRDQCLDSGSSQLIEDCYSRVQ